MNAVKFEGWEIDPDIAPDVDSIWTNYLKGRDSKDGDIEMVVTGKVGNKPPFSCEVLAMRDGKQVVIWKSIEDDFETACRTAEIEARRASIKIVKGN
ncbi:hypothetical protein NOF55_16450 [Rhizobiaceae bacterium BDR2-2]|uniref:Uncharacterized protein n=1 Tax=Ectorhizobium quercum TaxID=2965071 RepID=A0AAE3MXT8_9HYPH|nr:hypothetical protein [Ectorhizobium quercum]MCX8996256.1 hypothetical protein [Ectorhizobium quercum]MCX8998705.1 hypothetical protein [Ectorhizobium quercum]